MPTSHFEHLDWQFDDSTGIGHVMIDRPESLNALASKTRTELTEAFRTFERLDDESDGVAVRAVILSGAGNRAFSVGADTTEFDNESAKLAPIRLYETIEEYGAPIIAQIDGYCLGGGLELALTCDFRLASKRSELGQPEIDVGLCPAAGATQRLPALVGPDRTKELCMTGERLSGVQADAEGIVTAVHPADDLEAETQGFAERLAAKPPLGVRAVKHTTNHAGQVGIREGIAYEWAQFYRLMETADHREAMTAREEKRPPEWRGR